MNDEITALLPALSAGDPDARDRITHALYASMRELARGQLNAEHGERTLGTTELVNECFLRLFGGKVPPEPENRRHLLGIAARAMRQVLIDAARRRRARAPQQAAERFSLTGVGADLPIDERPEDLDETLNTLERLDPRQARIVELRYFAGLSQEETAQALSISLRTVQREWRLARAWLLRELDMSA